MIKAATITLAILAGADGYVVEIDPETRAKVIIAITSADAYTPTTGQVFVSPPFDPTAEVTTTEGLPVLDEDGVPTHQLEGWAARPIPEGIANRRRTRVLVRDIPPAVRDLPSVRRLIREIAR